MAVASDIDCMLMRAVEVRVAPGVVALAADDADIIYAGAFGARKIGGAADISLDTVMWIASMTKAVTSVAAMQLVEQGRIGLDEPLGEHIPDLAVHQVLEGFDVAGNPRLRAARRPVTLRQLLTHTSGFAYHIWNAETRRYLEATGTPTIDACQLVTLGTPAICDPGERFEYGIGIDWVGRTVEHLSGQSLEDYFRENIFTPLGMHDSGFLLRSAQRPRLASLHERQPDGSLMATDFEMTQQPEFFMGGGGLYSTGNDYLRFIRMLLGAGQLDGARVLRAETVAEMTRNQIGDLAIGRITSVIPADSNDFEFFPGLAKKWGLAGMLTMEDAPTGRSAGSLAWGGLANTYWWVDPGRRVAGVLLTQILPFADPGVLALFDQFERAIYAGVTARTRQPT